MRSLQHRPPVRSGHAAHSLLSHLFFNTICDLVIGTSMISYRRAIIVKGVYRMTSSALLGALPRIMVLCWFQTQPTSRLLVLQARC